MLRRASTNVNPSFGGHVCVNSGPRVVRQVQSACACAWFGWCFATTSIAAGAEPLPAVSTLAAETAVPPQAASPSSIPGVTEPTSLPSPAAAPADPMLALVPPAPRTLAGWGEAINLIRARSIDLRIALLDVAKAEASSRSALASALPSLNAGANYTHQLMQRTTQSASLDAAGNRVVRSTTNPTPDTASANVSLSVPIFNLPAWYSIGTARMGEEVAHLSVSDQKRRLTLGVANAIIAVVTAERVAELNRNGLSSALSRQALTAAKFRNGVATALDVERANQDVISTRSAVLNGDESLRRAREALGLALGFAEPIGVRPDLKLDALLTDTRTTCQPLTSLRERADIAVLQKKKEVQDRQITSVKLQFAPTMSLSSGIGTSTPHSSMAPPVTWNIQATLNWSLWDGGARYGALRSARASAEQADANRESLERSTIIALKQAERAVAVATDAVAVAKQARDAAVQVDDMTQKLFRAGAATSLELVTAATSLRQAEINLATRQFDLVNAQVSAALSLAICTW